MSAHGRCMQIRYSTDELLQIRNKRCCGIPRDLRRFLFLIRLQRECKQTHVLRKSRANTIPVRITQRLTGVTAKRLYSSPSSSPRVCVLRSLSRQDRHCDSSRLSRPLNFGLLNVRSLHNKLDDVLETYTDCSIGVLLMTETWHDENSNCVCRLRQLGYNVLDRPRPRSHRLPTVTTNHGGLIAFSPSAIRLEVIPLGKIPTTFESLCFRVFSVSSSMIILLIYRTGPVLSNFFEELAEILDVICTFSDPVIVTGDFNIHVERNKDPNAARLTNTLSIYGMHCKVNAPTHDLGGTLDLVFSTASHPIRPTVTNVGLSDHFLVQWKSVLSLPPLIYRTVHYRPWSNLNLSEFRFHLTNSPLCNSASWKDLNVDHLALLYDTTMLTILNDLVPVKSSRLPRRPSNPWFDDECQTSKRSVRRIERYLQDCSSAPPDLFNFWKSRLREYRSLLRTKRTAYWRSRMHSDRNSPKSLWNAVSILMGLGKPPLPPSIRAEEFLDFFHLKASNARGNTAHSAPPCFSSAPDDCKFSEFKSIPIEILSRFLRSLPNKCSSVDPIPTWLLKDCADLLCPLLAEIFNKSLLFGVVPLSWKRAQIKPILKNSAADPLDVSSYRPISNLSVLSKLMERVVSDQLQRHSSKNCLLPKCQSAYRPHHSSETAVLKIISDTLSFFDKGEVCLLVFLDMSSAFDCVDHDILIQRLEISCGVSGAPLQWLTSFLSNRSMTLSRVADDGGVALTSGVPQGSVLGPQLFSLYIADIVHVVESHGLHIHLFADDIVIYGSSKGNINDMRLLSSHVSLCLSDVKAWLDSNRLSINPQKTKAMWCHSSRRRVDTSVPVSVSGVVIQPQNCVQYLGVTLDSNLLMTANVSKTASTCFSMLRRIRTLRKSLTRPLLINTVTALVLSRLDYCLSAHAGLPSSTLWRLQRVIHASARLVYGAGKYDHVSDFLHELEWLSVSERIDVRLGTLAFQCKSALAPVYLIELLVDVASLPGRERLRSSTSGHFATPRVQHPTFGGRSFQSLATRVWNNIPSAVSSTESVSSFKRNFKKYILFCKEASKS